MNDIVKRLQERRLSAVAEARKIAERAADENRAFTGEEELAWQAANSELDALDARIKAMLEGEQRAKDTADAIEKIDGRPKDPTAGTQSAEQAELRAWAKGEDNRRVFEVNMPAGVTYRDLSKLTAGAGLNTVSTSFYGQLMEHLIETAGVMQLDPTVLTTSSGETIQVPKTTTHSTAAIVAEAGTIAESDPALGQLSLGAFKYGVLIEVSRELIDDTGVDLIGYLSRQAGRALGNAFGQDLVTGTGSGEPRGVIIDAAAGVTGPTGTTTTFGNQATVGQGFDLLISLFHSVIAPYRNSASAGWLMNDTTAALVRRIKSTDGVYAWQPSLVVGAPDTILGKPVVIDPNVASPAANAESIAFGDWSTYFVRIVGGVRFERSDDFRFANDLVAFRALLRGDGALTDLTGSIKTLTHSAT